jgi:enoyl-CoA hydratase/carnithine racemase
MTNMEWKAVDYRVESGVARVTLNRPGQMNAIDAVMYDELCVALDQAAGDEAVNVLLVTGAGDRAFCAGLDLNARSEQGPMTVDKIFQRTIHPERSLNFALVAFKKPFIAAVNGVAAGGGLAVALSADIVIAADTARFGTGHVKLGLPLLDMLGYLIPRRVGPGRASDVAFTGRVIDAEEALRIGFADRLVPAAGLGAAAIALAEEIAANAPLALYFSKQAIRRASADSAMEYARYERYIFNSCFYSEDAKEAMRARRDKRPPVYKGR